MRPQPASPSLLYVLLTTPFFSLATALPDYLTHGSHMFQLCTLLQTVPFEEGTSFPVFFCRSLLAYSSVITRSLCKHREQRLQ